MCACREDTDTARRGILDAVKGAIKGEAAGEAGAMVISRSWLRSWQAKQCRLIFLTDGALSPTHAIVCRHGRLLPETHMKGCGAARPARMSVDAATPCVPSDFSRMQAPHKPHRGAAARL